MKTHPSPTPPSPTSDLDAAAAAAEAARFRRTVRTVVGGLIIGVLAGAGVGILAGDSVTDALARSGESFGIIAGVLNTCYMLAVDYRPHLIYRLGLSRGPYGDEREQQMSDNIAVKIFSATLMVTLLYSVLFTHDRVIVWIIAAGMVGATVAIQIRARRA